MSVQFSKIDDYHIIGSEPCGHFDSLTRLAVKICSTDAAYISLVDENRQWFKSKVGFDQEEEEFSRSICHYLISNNLSHLHIPDLSLDPIFKDSSAFLEYGLRFYAGFPLIAPDNTILGSFCVISFQPHQLDEVKLDFLRTMAAQTINLLESHKLNYELSVQSALLEKINKITDKGAVIGRLGGLYLNLATMDIFWRIPNNVLFNLRADYSMTLEEFKSGNFKIENSATEVFEIIRNIYSTHIHEEYKFSFEHELLNKTLIIKGELVNEDLYVVFQDVSDQYKLNHELKLYKALMEQVEEIVNLGGWSYDLRTEEIFWTKNIYAIYDLPLGGKISLLQAKSYFVEDSLTEMEVDFNNLLENGTPYKKEFLLISNNGTEKWIKASGTAIYSNGGITQVVGSLQDISKEKKLREQLQKSKMDAVIAADNYKSLVNNSSFYICKTDVSGRFTFCNDLYTTKIGTSLLETSLGKSDFFHAVKPDYLELVEKVFFNVASGQESECRVLVKEINNDQKEVDNLWDFIGLKNSDNDISEVLCLGYDVSELEDNKAQIQLLADYTSFQNKKLLEYNSIVSHDIRSHVANAIGLINLIDLVNDLDERDSYYQLLKEEIKKTDRTLIGLDKLTSKNTVFESRKEPISLYHLVEHVFELIRKTKPHTYFNTINSIPDDLIIFTIREYLENVFVSVFSNSLKLISPERELLIEISAAQTSKTILQIKIVDNGIGIDMKQYGKELFKIQRPQEDTQYGNEVGLYLVKKQIEALGGRVDIQSENGNGTTILLDFLNYED